MKLTTTRMLMSYKDNPCDECMDKCCMNETDCDCGCCLTDALWDNRSGSYRCFMCLLILPAIIAGIGAIVLPTTYPYEWKDAKCTVLSTTTNMVASDVYNTADGEWAPDTAQGSWHVRYRSTQLPRIEGTGDIVLPKQPTFEDFQKRLNTYKVNETAACKVKDCDEDCQYDCAIAPKDCLNDRGIKKSVENKWADEWSVFDTTGVVVGIVFLAFLPGSAVLICCTILCCRVVYFIKNKRRKDGKGGAELK